MVISYFILFFLQVFTSTLIYFSINPIYSLILLILLFFESAVVLSFFSLEFMPILFILIYVGAIAILFLFVIMLLQLKLNDLETLFFLPFFFSLNVIAGFFLFSNFPLFYMYPNIFFPNLLEEKFNELFIVGQFLYNYSALCFLLAGIILLLALVGSIVLSLIYKQQNFNLFFKKVSRSNSFLSFFN